jgi:hypothetical protein
MKIVRAMLVAGLTAAGLTTPVVNVIVTIIFVGYLVWRLLPFIKMAIEYIRYPKMRIIRNANVYNTVKTAEPANIKAIN